MWNNVMAAFLEVPPLQNQSAIQIPNVCGVCSANHYTGNCPALSTNVLITDKEHQDNLSRYSVPDGLLIVDCHEVKSSIVITTQKFAKGTRFGPVLAPKSYVPPSRTTKFPLVIFNEVWNCDPFLDDLSDDIKELFNVRNYYLDTSDENKCNWMIHVDIAKFSNEQNLMAYQENDQIYYTSTRDIELGDILKVWYSPPYASRMGVSLLEASNNMYSTNILRQVSFDYGIKLQHEEKESDVTNNNYLAMAPLNSSPSSSEITLPPINSLMKNQSPNYNLDFDNLILMAKNDQQTSATTYLHHQQQQHEYMDTFPMNIHDSIGMSDGEKVQQQLSSSSSTSSIKQIKFTEVSEAESQKFACELCARKYITKSNLEKHMRSHDLFMCVVCMKMFHNPDELKEHDCFKQKTSAKKSLFHCAICWKVLSNSWSLNRHMKIHRNAMASESNVSEKSDDLSDEFLVPPTPSSLPEQEPYAAVAESSPQPEIISEPIYDPLMTPIMENYTPATDPLDVHHSWMESSVPQQSSAEDSEPQSNFDKCIVCARAFKNPNSLDKHLRNVHTAHIIRPELTTSIKKSSEYRRIVLNKKPIKENVAKALASKLNKKNLQQYPAEVLQNQQQHHQQETGNRTQPDLDWNGNGLTQITSDEKCENVHSESSNGNTIIIISNVELNPAQSPITSNGYTFSNAIMPKLVPIGLKRQNGLNDFIPPEPIKDDERSMENDGTSPKVFIIDKVGEPSTAACPSRIQSKMAADDDDEYHQCPECEKVFHKKYQLKRHQEIHENLFYFCPFCPRAPVKARSSLRKHLLKEHPEHQDTWQASNFMSSLLKKYEKVKKTSHSDCHESTKKVPKVPKVKKEPKEPKKPRKSKKNSSSSLIISSDRDDDDRCEIINDEPLPQVNNVDDGDELREQHHQHQQQIILHNLFLDPITLDEENNLIKYTLAGDDDDFIMNGHNHHHHHSTSTVDTVSTINHNHGGSIESYEMSEFSNFKSSFDEIQEKLDADLEFNNDQMIKWSDELNDSSSSVISSPSGASNLSSPDVSKSMGKKKVDGFMMT